MPGRIQTRGRREFKSRPLLHFLRGRLRKKRQADQLIPLTTATLNATDLY